jgi:hypothetical protein
MVSTPDSLNLRPMRTPIIIADDDAQRRRILDAQDTQRRHILNAICSNCERALLFTKCRIGKDGLCPLDEIVVALRGD